MEAFLQIVGFIAAFSCLAGYFIANKTGKLRIYNWINVITSLILTPLAVYWGAYPSATLSGAYGAIAAWALIKE